MPRVSEEIEIRAPREEVWHVVQEDLAATTEWSQGRMRAATVDGKPAGSGALIRFELTIGGGEQSLVLQNQTWRPPELCAGPIVEGPVKGSFAYSYRKSGVGTLLRFEMDAQLSGLLRFAGGVFKSQLETNLREALSSLKAYIERRSAAAR
ncbi:MAG: SRPBCC family protein [Candidatus Dormibacteraeota bacterium]|uniref:SRPBCC family protein n=1 Tax=Candidatus Dormiibacter inghamiae TaxID=3127013 RepID=A0A934K5S9_9BACT|nr:SRPBCC family protein [Candidatus Dormibacteraeota bacterium]MBJ7605952.1 SRPBCC family protein [Candidatus Dormibacteraeota bacterium]